MAGRVILAIVAVLLAGSSLAHDSLSEASRKEATLRASALVLAMNSSLDQSAAYRIACILESLGLNRVSEVQITDSGISLILADGRWYEALIFDDGHLSSLKDYATGELLFAVYL
jgi:hypothetical protein